MKGELDFNTAFKYPFNRWVGLFNVFWVLLPIFGWFALLGYTVRLVKSWVKQEFKQLPEFSFGSDMSLGFVMFIKLIPFAIAVMIAFFVLAFMPFVGAVANFFIGIFVIPMLVINFFVKEEFAALFDFDVIKPVFNNLADYVVALLKSLALQVVFVLLSILLVGIPAGMFTKNIFMADFYARRVLKK